MKHSLFTRLMSLFLTFALLLPCFPMASATEIPDTTETPVIDTTVTEPANEATTAATEAPAETTPVVETDPPVEESTPVEESVAPTESTPIEETLPPVETTPVEETTPVDETTPEEETLPVDETLPEDETIPEDELTELLPFGMPEDYVLNSKNEEFREKMLEHDTLNALNRATPGVDYINGQILVMAETEEEAQLIAEAYCGTLASWNNKLAVILLGEATVVQAVEASLSGEYNLPVASPNYLAYVEPKITRPSAVMAADVPHEMTWSDWVQDVMVNPDPALLLPYASDYQYHHDVIESYAAWGVTTGQYSVNVAVIDTGVQSNHPDLRVTEYKVPGVNLTGDSNGHGTNVCGIIAATMDNGLGGAGVAPYINLSSYRVTTGSSGSMSHDAIIAAIYAAADNGADIINMSLGGYFYDVYMQEAIDYATVNRGVTVVAAMGNDGTNVKCYPAAYRNVIAVGATNKANQRAFFSNYGSWCDISAPGVDIYSTYPGSSYDWMSGTSQATPVVVGAIALYMSFYGNPGPAKMEKILESNAVKCSDSGMGAGIVNAANMLDHKPGTPGYRLRYNNSILYDFGAHKSQVVPCESLLEFGTQGMDDTWYILYTINGKTPSVKNGKIVHGTVYDWNGIDLTPYAGTTITVRARQVSGMGISGSVLTKKIKVDDSNQITGITISGPDKLIAGKEGKFAATVLPDHKADPGVTWSIISRSGTDLASAKITAKGILTTSKNAYGKLTIKATSTAKTSISKTHVVEINKFSPVYKMSLTQSSATLYVGYGLNLGMPKMTDKSGYRCDADVRWTTSDKKIATVDANGNVTALKKGKVTITCSALDGSKKTAKCTVTVKQQVTDITITGNTAVAPGSSTTLKTTITPSGATSKSVTWSLVSAPAGVTVSKSGVVKVPSGVTSGTIQVRATAKDGMGATDTHKLVIQKKITAMRLEPRTSYTGWAGGFTYKSGKLNTITMFSVDLNESSGQDNYCALKAVPTGSSVDVKWTSSNSSVVSVSQYGDITAHKAGTAKITCTPQDGSKKTATVTVKVVNPVSFMEIKTNARQMTNRIPYIGFGKSVTASVVFGKTYGTPTNKKVTWDYEILEYNSSGSYVKSWTTTFKNKKLVTIKDGKVSVSSKAKTEWNSIGGEFRLRLKAYSNDGSGTMTTKDFLLIPPSTKMKMIKNTRFNMGRETWGSVCFESDQWNPFRNDYNCGFVATSSNPNIVGVREVDGTAIHPCDHYYGSFGTPYDLYIVSGTKKGTATITIKATDGSGKSCKFTVTVK